MPDTPEVIDAEVTQEQVAPLARVEERRPPTGLMAVEDPVEYIQKATKVATALKDVLRARNLVKKIGQNEYVEIGGWQLLGGMVKIYCSTEWTRQTEDGWEAKAFCHDAYGNQVSAAEAQCSNRESHWKGRDDFQIRSMAQTRAQAKAYRSALGFIVELAGYKATPVEEMGGDDDAPKKPPRRAAKPTKTDAPPENGQKPMPTILEMHDRWLAEGRSHNEWEALLGTYGIKRGDTIDGTQKAQLLLAIEKMPPVKKTLKEQADQAGLPLA